MSKRGGRPCRCSRARRRSAGLARINAALRSMRTSHGATMARQSRTILRGALQLAVMAGVLGTNPVRDVAPISSQQRPKGATALTAAELRDLLAKHGESKYCRDHDLDRDGPKAIRTAGSPLARLRRPCRDDHGHQEGGAGGWQGPGARRGDQE